MGDNLGFAVVPERIAPEAWLALYERSLTFLKQCRIPLMSLYRETAWDSERTVFTHILEKDEGRPDQRHWSVVGDFDTLERGDGFELYADIQVYERGSKRKDQDADFDILRDRATDQRRQVMGGATYGLPYKLPMLAVMMMFEQAFPKAAYVTGDFTGEDVRQARLLLRNVLNEDVPTPVRWDAPSLWRRLEDIVEEGEDAVSMILDRFDEHFQGGVDVTLAFLKDHASEALEPWFFWKLHECRKAEEGLYLYTHWLNLTGDLQSLMDMVCRREVGPCVDPITFSHCLAHLDLVTRAPKGSSQNRSAVTYVENDRSLYLLKKPLDASLLVQAAQALELQEAQAMGDAYRLRRSVLERVEGDVHQEDVPKVLAWNASPERLSDDTKLFIYDLAIAVGEYRRANYAIFPEIFTKNILQFKKMIVDQTAENGIYLTENAWRWLDAEDDRDLLTAAFLLCNFDRQEAVFLRARRRLLERKDLFEYFTRQTFEHPDDLALKN